MLNDLLQILEKYGQFNLLEHHRRVPARLQPQWIQQLQALDLPLLSRLHKDLVIQANNCNQTLQSMQPTPMPYSLAQQSSDYLSWKKKGEELLAEGKVAAFLVAGGQGSRLGFDGPKGICGIGLPSGRSLFQLQAERLLYLQRRHGKAIPWCIMTSPLNHDATVNFFTENKFFGLHPNSVRFFPQGMLPALDQEGQVLLDSCGQIALAPDGNGGCFRALHSSGNLQWLKDQSVEFVFLYSVDNALVLPCDPAFVGALHNSQAPCSSKVVAKAHAAEKVGVFALLNGLPKVIEYSDLPADLREQRNEKGDLLFASANIANHLFRLSALEAVANSPLPYHVAHKKIPFYRDEIGRVNPSEPNAWKFEQFLFDIFPLLGKMQTYGVERRREFAPVKNASGDDSPMTALNLLGNLHRNWLIEANILLPANNDLYEISPLLSYQGEGLCSRVWDQALHKTIQIISPSEKTSNYKLGESGISLVSASH